MNEPLPQWTAWVVLVTTLPIWYAIVRFVLFQRQANVELTSVPWVTPATTCLNAYVKREYSVCAAAGQAALLTDFLPTVGLVTVLALRRLDHVPEAEELGRNLLLRSFGPNGSFLMHLRILDNDLAPERSLIDQRNGMDSISTECEVYFYWGAKLLTDGNYSEAFKPLLLATWADCDVMERELANADLRTVTEHLISTGDWNADSINKEATRILAEHDPGRYKP